MAIVISEDGGVDIIPNLRPAIRRSDISRRLSEIKRMRSDVKINMNDYSNIMDWFDNHRFYLQKEDCDSLNVYYTELETRIDEQTHRAIRIVRNGFLPNDNLDKSLYYLPEE